MAFTPETGAIVANANSYVTLAYANAYFVDRGSPTDWTNAVNEDRQAALIYATTWLDQNMNWYSTIQDLSQSLGWPRVSFFDREGRTVGGSGVIPVPVKDATCELALQWLKDDFTDSSNEGIKSESIGSTSITYATTSSRKNFTFVKMSLKDYATSGSNVATIYRA